MSEKKVDVDAKVDELEAAAEKYASANTVISIGGYEFTPAKLMVAFTIVSTILGGLYGAFEVYKDYQDMKTKIAEYVTPDLAEIYKKLEVLETSTNKTVEYSQDIKNDLKSDIRRLESVVENVERDSKVAQRETDKSVQDARRDVRETKQEVDRITRSLEKDTAQQNKDMQKEVATQTKELQKEVATQTKELQRSVDTAVKQLQKENEAEIKTLRRELDDKIKKALDNPLSNR
jgi:chromosome segregation ATPase